ncbi:MAG: methyl-accepting chemotaxis protein [Desulfovibrio sp.]
MSGRSFFSIFRGLSITAKLTVSSLVFVLPIALLFYFVFSVSYGNISLTRLEMRGNAYIRPLSSLLQQVAEHERLVAQFFDGTVGEDKPRALEKSMDARFEELATLHETSALALELDPDGLERRGRQRLAADQLEQRWQQLKQWKGGGRGDFEGRHAALISDFIGLIELVGGTSNLGLDPDQDSTALVREVLDLLPRTQALISEIISYYATSQEAGEVSEMARQQFLLLGAELRRVGYADVIAAGRTALEEDAFYYGVSPSLQENLNPLLRRYEASARDFLEYVNMLADSARGSLVKPPLFYQSALQLRRTARELSEITSTELDALLQRRLADHRATLWIIVGTCGGALLLAFGLVALIGRSVVRPIARIRVFTRSIAQEDFSATLDARFSGELGELAQDIQAMLATLKRFGFAQGLLDGLTSPCFVVDTDFRLTFVNQAMLDLLEREGGVNGFLGRYIKDFFYMGVEGEVLAERVQAERAAVVNHERELETDRGARRFVRLDAAPLYDLEGALMGSFTLVTDLTAVKENEQQVRTQVETMSAVAAGAEEIADDVAEAASRLESQIEDVARGSSNQKSRTVETVTAMEEMNASVSEVARNAGQAAREAQEAIIKAEQGERTVDNVIAAIRAVQGHAETLRTAMRALDEEAGGIGTVMSVIEDIADQTNLLALNAAIEAARAGDAGRGFAVVADEVRKLAEKTMDATKQVGRAILSIQKSTEQSVSATDEAVEAVRSSTEQASLAGEALRGIVEAIESNSNQIRAIATAAEQQAATSEEISRSVSGIDGVCDETTLHVQDARQAIERLSRLAEDLRRVIQGMRVD